MPSITALLAGRLQLLALAEIGGEGDHLGLVGLLQPLQDDRRIEAARIGEHDLLDGLLRLGHGVLCSFNGMRTGVAGKFVPRTIGSAP